MSKVLAVFGATGQQGSFVVNYVLSDLELSQKYKIRAIARDVDSEKAKRLKEKVEVVYGNALDRASLEIALTGVHTVFAMTPPGFGPEGSETEINSAKAMADVAVGKNVDYFIWSTLPPVSEISGGKYTKVAPFDAKAKAEQYIRGLPIKSAFVSLGSFMQNFQPPAFVVPRKTPDGTFVMSLQASPKAQFPLIDVVGDTGKFVGAILAEPDKYEGKTFCCATRLYTLKEICSIMTKTTGKTVVYKKIPLEEFKENISFLGDTVVEIRAQGFSYYDEFGYFGPDSEKLVAWAAENARGRLSTFEDYLEAHPLQLA